MPLVSKRKGGKLNPDNYECTQHIKDTFSEITSSYVYTWKNNVVTMYYKDENPDVYIKYIAQILSLIQPHGQPLIADIILSSAKKYYPPGKIFGPDHVNTGYATNNHIVVYRKEECLKVFIHECFHFFNFDQTLFEPLLQRRVIKLFPVKSDVNLFESYCEIWARTLNCCMVSVNSRISWEELLEREKKYSLRHMVNVLKHMELTYQSILTSENTFQEETNVLAYVVLGAIFMHHDYLSHYVQGKTITPDMFVMSTPNEYVSFLEQHYQDDEFMSMVKRLEKSPIKHTTTMSTVRLIPE